MADQDLQALRRRLEGKIALAKAHSPSHVLLLLPAAERLLAALKRIPELERDLEGTRSAYRAALAPASEDSEPRNRAAQMNDAATEHLRKYAAPASGEEGGR